MSRPGARLEPPVRTSIDSGNIVVARARRGAASPTGRAAASDLNLNDSETEGRANRWMPRMPLPCTVRCCSLPPSAASRPAGGHMGAMASASTGIHPRTDQPPQPSQQQHGEEQEVEAPDQNRVLSLAAAAHQRSPGTGVRRQFAVEQSLEELGQLAQVSSADPALPNPRFSVDAIGSLSQQVLEEPAGPTQDRQPPAESLELSDTDPWEAESGGGGGEDAGVVAGLLVARAESRLPREAPREMVLKEVSRIWLVCRSVGGSSRLPVCAPTYCPWKGAAAPWVCGDHPSYGPGPICEANLRYLALPPCDPRQCTHRRSTCTHPVPFFQALLLAVSERLLAQAALASERQQVQAAQEAAAGQGSRVTELEQELRQARLQLEAAEERSRAAERVAREQSDHYRWLETELEDQREAGRLEVEAARAEADKLRALAQDQSLDTQRVSRGLSGVQRRLACRSMTAHTPAGAGGGMGGGQAGA